MFTSVSVSQGPQGNRLPLESVGFSPDLHMRPWTGALSAELVRSGKRALSDDCVITTQPKLLKITKFKRAGDHIFHFHMKNAATLLTEITVALKTIL
eukprot:m.17608 g.17608  ORF g.17608 m.17608 type:complete len:97 (-) comp6059_c0_seq2:71-361(-)